MSQLITIIGRGHGGTRAMSQTLVDSGVFMGEPLNASYDLIPAHSLYEACRVMARHVRHLGGTQWDFSNLHDCPIDPDFKRLVDDYLQSVHASDATRKGWKLPETTLILPWIVRLYPEAHYINWLRDARDSILGAHLTDDLAAFGVPYDKPDDGREMRAISWKYQVELIKATPKPKNWISVRFEDFVLDQEATLARLERFLGFELARIPVKPEVVGRWKSDAGRHMFDFLEQDLREHGYLDAEGTR